MSDTQNKGTIMDIETRASIIFSILVLLLFGGIGSCSVIQTESINAAAKASLSDCMARGATAAECKSVIEDLIRTR